MKTSVYFLFIIAVLFAAGCGSSVKVFHDLDPATDFTGYTTYNFLQWTEGNIKSINELERERLKTAIARELEQHGLAFSEKEADLSVQITVYHREMKEMIPSYPYYYTPFYNPYYGWGPRVYNYLERAIAVDIYDNKAKKHIWHSAAVGELTGDPQKRQEQLPQVTEKMFRDFPKQRLSAL
ncbi:MAG: DUF4136 domain-containing protein [Bacteroidales bacterium]|nr:DUF4136 domain-containing protein [Bacteroidales bacterium]MBN2698211.1 DUF4136 domain-containing protein [Bacteroidales bacterium]